MFTAPVDPSVRTRRVKPNHEPWKPQAFQRGGVQFLKEHAAGALFWDPGLGKTSTVLEAFRQLKLSGQVDNMLVVAPLRVCQLVWRQEGQKWTQFRDLTFSLLHGSKKADRLREDADIYLINPEGIPWLYEQFMGRGGFPFDIVCVDELTKFKNHRAHRSKKLRKKLGQVRYRWGLTGTPAPNGYMDLFGQMLLLDDGAALGKAITYFRDKYFQPAFNGFSWDLRKGSDKRIEERIAPYVLRMSAKDYLELPQLKENPIEIVLPPKARALYDEMEKEMLVALPDGVVTAANSGAVYAKLSQMANGAVYYADAPGERKWAEIHTAKLDALEDLIEELSGQPLLVAYEFQHDLARIRSRLGEDTPALAGANERQAVELERAWNEGELPVLLVHPASVGHGLNLQRAAGTGTAHLCWFSLPWDLELYDQTIRRLMRQGSTADRVMSHMLMVRGGMDEVKYAALQGKDTTQQKLLTALNAAIMRDEPAPHATGNVARSQDNIMADAKKLGFRNPKTSGGGDDKPAPKKGWGNTNIADEDELPPTGPSVLEDRGEEGESAYEEVTQPAKKGWGAVAAPDEQRTAIRSKLEAPAAEPEDEDEGPSPAQRAMAAFGSGIVSKLEGEGEDDDQQEDDGTPAEAPAAEPEKPKRRTRKATSKAADTESDDDADFEQKTATLEQAAKVAPTIAERARRQEASASGGAYAAHLQHEYPTGHLSVSYNGIPGAALADIFAALAEQFRNA